MDYLLRDSLHTGVSYGRYDWQRLVKTTVAVPSAVEGSSPRIGVMEGGLHAAEGLIVARYFMFSQVYFHKTRVIYDHHLQKALTEILPGNLFPKPSGDDLDEYLKWDDWRVLGLLAEGKGGEHGGRLANRNHYREVTHTPELPTKEDLERLDKWRDALSGLLAAEIPAAKSWYKTGDADISVMSETPDFRVQPLSIHSSVVKNIKSVQQVRLYARPEYREKAVSKVTGI